MKATYSKANVHNTSDPFVSEMCLMRNCASLCDVRTAGVRGPVVVVVPRNDVDAPVDDVSGMVPLSSSPQPDKTSARAASAA